MAGIAVNMTLDDISYHVKLDGKLGLIDRKHNSYEMLEIPTKIHFFLFLYDHVLNKGINLSDWIDIKILMTSLFRKRAR